MKNIVLLLAVLILFSFALAGCGNDDPTQRSDPYSKNYQKADQVREQLKQNQKQENEKCDGSVKDQELKGLGCDTQVPKLP